MSTGATAIYLLPYPELSDPVHVQADIKSLADRLELVFPSAGFEYLTYSVKNSSGATIAKGTPVHITGYSSGTTVAKALSTNAITLPIIGLATGAISNAATGTVMVSGIFSDIDTSSFTVGDILYVATSGGLTATQPAAGGVAVGQVAKSHASTGVIIVGQPKGNGTWGSLKAGLA